MKPAILIGFLSLLSACQPRVGRYLAQGRAFTVAVSTSGCMGTCPVYRLRIASDGSAQYRGIHFVAREDTFTTQLPDSAVTQLRQALVSSRFPTLDSVYDDPYVSDLPSTQIRLRMPASGYQKTVTSRVDPPPRLQKLEAKLRHLHDTYFQ